LSGCQLSEGDVGKAKRERRVNFKLREVLVWRNSKENGKPKAKVSRTSAAKANIQNGEQRVYRNDVSLHTLNKISQLPEENYCKISYNFDKPQHTINLISHKLSQHRRSAGTADKNVDWKQVVVHKENPMHSVFQSLRSQPPLPEVLMSELINKRDKDHHHLATPEQVSLINPHAQRAGYRTASPYAGN
jgi:hypothetical protein